MTKKDVFANIANNSISGRKELLKEIYPKKNVARHFQMCDDNKVDYCEKSRDENLEDYYIGLKELKEKFQPYLIRYPKKLNFKNKVINITKFKYKFEDNKEYENITIPHYHGPAKRWESVYTTIIDVSNLDKLKKTYIVFKGVDYYADIYINNEHVMYHEGFFAKFECDISKYIGDSITLKVIVRNDLPTIGSNNMQNNGDKLYAATGIGWDNPEDGWHHCPAGGGIFDKVYIEQREKVHIRDIFLRPDIDNNCVFININLYSHIDENIEKELSLNILPYNFNEDISYIIKEKIKVGYGNNYYDFKVELNNYRLWESEQPFLYLCQSNVEKSYYEAKFGMRKFHMDEKQKLKGTLYFNNKKVILRGANEMGHLQLCVVRNDYDQLIEDILIAKYCNMNCYRITQRPVQEEIYDYCDMLGMMNQVDFPLFGFMRKNKFFEGVKQAGEMERLVRNHPSVIVASYINEPFPPTKYNLQHRHLSRPELELFFDACDAAIYFENPDRVVKRVEGDYDPPTNKGLSDFHCYNMWYTNHALPVGMLYKGYLPAIKKGWKVGCGEYGAEGLDNLEVMKKYYPKEWLPENDSDFWISDKIIKAQTNTMHGDWYEAQSNINDWINESQKHQAFATKLMTEAFRRRNDILIYTAIHLLIDAWPSGWMKTLLDVDRVPKLAYFAFKESQQPLKVSLRCDRWQVYEDETINVEAWILNDSNKNYRNMQINATICDDTNDYYSYSLDKVKIKACNSEIGGIIPIKIPKIGKDTNLYIDVELIKGGNVVNIDRFKVKTFPKSNLVIPVFPIGKLAKIIVNQSQLIEVSDYYENCTLLISSVKEYNKYKDSLANNKKVFLNPDEINMTYDVDNKQYEYAPIFKEEVGESCELKGLSFVACNKKYQNKYQKDGFSYWYNNDKEYIDHVTTRYIKGEFDEHIVFAYEKPSFGKRTKGKKNELAIVSKVSNSYFVSLEIDGRLNYNPILDRLLGDIIK